jgi:hypothetical protein
MTHLVSWGLPGQFIEFQAFTTEEDLKSGACMSNASDPECYSLKIETKDVYSYQSWEDALTKTSWNAKTANPQAIDSAQNKISDIKILKIIDQVAYLTFEYEQVVSPGASEVRQILGKGIIHLPTIAGGNQTLWSHFYLHYDAETAQPYYAWMKSKFPGFENYKEMYMKQWPIIIEGKIYRLIQYFSKFMLPLTGNSEPQFTLDNAQDPHAEFDAVELRLETNRIPGEYIILKDISYHNGKMILYYQDSSFKRWVKEFVISKDSFLAPTREATLLAEGNIMDGLFPGYAEEFGPFDGGL